MRHLQKTILSCILLWNGCANRPACLENPKQPPAVVLTTSSGKELRIEVELATRAEQRARGLMYRRHLEAMTGMLFVYPAEKVQSFWMENTYIPLDIIFIGENLRVLGTIQNTQPLSKQHLSIDSPSRYVLEVNAGVVKQYDIRVGSRIRLIGIHTEI